MNSRLEDPVEYLRDLGGVDIALTTVEALSAMRQAYESLALNGILVLIGLPTGELSLSLSDWVLKDIRVIGNIGFTRREIDQVSS
ncbi:MAG: zinc-binding dehydrogenase [Sulfolobales archaeon]